MDLDTRHQYSASYYDTDTDQQLDIVKGYPGIPGYSDGYKEKESFMNGYQNILTVGYRGDMSGYPGIEDGYIEDQGYPDIRDQGYGYNEGKNYGYPGYILSQAETINNRNQTEPILNPSKLPPYFYISNREFFNGFEDLDFNLSSSEFSLEDLSRLANLDTYQTPREAPTPTPSGRIPYPSYRPEYTSAPYFQPLPFKPRVYLPSSTIRPTTDSGQIRGTLSNLSSVPPRVNNTSLYFTPPRLYNTTPRNQYGNRIYPDNPINPQLPVTRGTQIQPWLHPQFSDQFFTVKSKSLSFGSILVPSPILIILVFTIRVL